MAKRMQAEMRDCGRAGFVLGLVALGRYDRAWFRHDAVAGVSVARSPVRTVLDRISLAGRIAPDRMFLAVASAVVALTRATP